jgi:hypothetical protein
MQEEIKSRLIRGMLATIRFSLLSSRLLSKDVKVKNIQNHNFASCFVWAWNLVSHIKGRE